MGICCVTRHCIRGQGRGAIENERALHAGRQEEMIVRVLGETPAADPFDNRSEQNVF
jgi:hypothetical protein